MGRREAVKRATLVLVAGLSIAGASPAAEPPSDLAARYRSAERFLPWNAAASVRNGAVATHWSRTGDSLWYRRDEPDGAWSYRRVEARGGRNTPAFDHAWLSGALAAQGVAAPAARLPLSDLDLDGSHLTFTAAGRRWRCARGGGCAPGPVPVTPGASPSPDGRWEAFSRAHDIWLRERATGVERRLTHDGTADNGYGLRSGNNTEYLTQRRAGPVAPLVIWSPDSRRLLTHRLDLRGVERLALLQSAPPDGGRPKVWEMPYAYPLDAQKPLERLVVLDVESGSVTPVRQPPVEATHATAIEDRYAWWGEGGRVLYTLSREPYARAVGLRRVDPATGAAVELIREQGPTYVEIAEEEQAPRVAILGDGRIVWFSERDGRGRLYLFDAAGRLTRPLTPPELTVVDLVRVDARRGLLVFTACGAPGDADPYLRNVYRVGLDGAGLRRLTPDPAEHALSVAGPGWPGFAEGAGLQPSGGPFAFSPGGESFVETFSRPDLPPVTVVRDLEGRVTARIEAADVAALRQTGWRPPETFSVTGADGRTRLYGSLFRPSDFDPTRRYPVVDALYPGPQMTRVAKDFMGSVFDPFEAQSLAELGFIVMTLDGRGTPRRSKAFTDMAYGRLSEAGSLEDHVAALRQLASARPYMDLGRVGVVGHSGGGYAAARAVLRYPEVFHVAVASSGNHDQRRYVAGWGEVYNGPDDGTNYAEADNAALAGRLRGRLLLIHGDMDDNVHPSQTLRLADALVRAGRRFDLAILPNANHRLLPGANYDPTSAYFVRLRWDYLVRHLLDRSPPETPPPQAPTFP